MAVGTLYPYSSHPINDQSCVTVGVFTHLSFLKVGIDAARHVRDHEQRRQRLTLTAAGRLPKKPSQSVVVGQCNQHSLPNIGENKSYLKPPPRFTVTLAVYQ